MRILGACVLALILLAAAATTAPASDITGIAPAKEFPRAQQPQLAVSSDGKVYLAFGEDDAIYVAASADGGKSFATPKEVGNAGVLSLGMRRGPRIAAAEKTVVVTAVAGNEGHGRDGDVLAWRSSNGGGAWDGPVKINSVAGAGREGLQHLAVSPSGVFYCVWLDLRNGKTQVYGAASADGGATWRDERLIYESPDGFVCQCCQPQATFDGGGRLHVMWRNHLDGARDMYLISSTDNGRSFGRATKLGRGTWPLEACPMDGGGIACDADGTVHTVWRREDTLFTATPGDSERSLGKGQQAWAASGPSGVYFIWIDRRPGAVMLLPPSADTPQKIAERGADPVIAGPASGKGPVVAAWQTNSSDGDRIQAAVIAPAQ